MNQSASIPLKIQTRRCYRIRSRIRIRVPRTRRRRRWQTAAAPFSVLQTKAAGMPCAVWFSMCRMPLARSMVLDVQRAAGSFDERPSCSKLSGSLRRERACKSEFGGSLHGSTPAGASAGTTRRERSLRRSKRQTKTESQRSGATWPTCMRMWQRPRLQWIQCIMSVPSE